jgi:peroxiredoxin Q/BCP
LNGATVALTEDETGGRVVYWKPLAVLLFGAAVIGFGTARAAALAVGDPAPDFSLRDQHGERHRLEDYRGRWLVLYFYPKDDTPGCTTEACEFRDDIYLLKQMRVSVVGVSLDDVKSHREFAEKYHLPFTLLSDAGGEVARRYGALTSLGFIKFARRHTFIIDPAGKIVKIYRSVNPGRHSDEVIADLRALGV